MKEENKLEYGDKIILFDGVCNLCDSAVQFIIKHDKNAVFKFASLQSDIGKRLLKERGVDFESIDSIVFIDMGSAYYIKSTAALEIARHLDGSYSFFKNFLVIPVGFRDWVYDFVARNRYKWYGKKDACMIPTADLKSRFLD